MKNGGGPNLWSPHRICNMLGIKVRTVRSGCSGCHSVVITAEGKAMTWGKKFDHIAHLLIIDVPVINPLNTVF